MKKTVILLIAMAVIAAPSIAQKMTIDYAHDFDFEQVKTFTYVDTPIRTPATVWRTIESRTNDRLLERWPQAGRLRR